MTYAVYPALIYDVMYQASTVTWVRKFKISGIVGAKCHFILMKDNIDNLGCVVPSVKKKGKLKIWAG